MEERTGRRPHSYLMDGGFATREDITATLEHRGVRVYAPVRLPRQQAGGGTVSAADTGMAEEAGYRWRRADRPLRRSQSHIQAVGAP